MCEIHTVAVAGPVDFIGGGEVGGQGSDPAHKAGRAEFSWIVGVTRGEWLEDMEGAHIARCPGDKWEQRKQPGREGETESGAESQGLAAINQQSRPEDHREQSSIGT